MAENAVGLIKMKARELLLRAQQTATYWGTAVLAAAHEIRAERGLDDHVPLPYGCRVMVVRDPKPRDAFAPRAELAVLLGPADSFTGSYWVYARGRIFPRANLQLAGVSGEELE